MAGKMVSAIWEEIRAMLELGLSPAARSTDPISKSGTRTRKDA